MNQNLLTINAVGSRRKLKGFVTDLLVQMATMQTIIILYVSSFRKIFRALDLCSGNKLEDLVHISTCLSSYLTTVLTLRFMKV